MISLTQVAYHIGKLWTKLKDAVFKTTFIWGSCRGLWYVTSNRSELTHALLGNPNPRLNKKSKPARMSETNITGLLKTIHLLRFSLCSRAAGSPRELLSHLDWESLPVWLSGAWLWARRDKSEMKTFMSSCWVKQGYKERKPRTFPRARGKSSFSWQSLHPAPWVQNPDPAKPSRAFPFSSPRPCRQLTCILTRCSKIKEA